MTERPPHLEMDLPEPTRYTLPYLDEALKWASANDVSDVTLQSGNPVFVERYGRLQPITRRKLTATELYQLAQGIYGDNAPSHLASGIDIDCSYEIKLNRTQLLRYRVNMTSIRDGRERGLEITIRTIPTTPPPIAQLNLPDSIRQSLVFEQGLILITGPTGSGKTTLLAAIIRSLLEQSESHRKILTYEAPIEYVYDHIDRNHALIAQHEIGVHLKSFAAGVRNSLRRKPMVILVGEARDAATIAAAVEAAMTGHLVYTTVHANSVPETIRRMVSVFPAEERDGRMMDILEALQTVITQRLVRTTDGQRTAIREHLRFTPDIKDDILARPAAQVVAATRKAVLDFGRPLTADLDELRAAGRIEERGYDLFRGLGTQLS